MSVFSSDQGLRPMSQQVQVGSDDIRIYLSRDQALPGLALYKDATGWYYTIKKTRVYVHSPQEVPQGFQPQQGRRGGIYYETSGRSSVLPQPTTQPTQQQTQQPVATPTAQPQQKLSSQKGYGPVADKFLAAQPEDEFGFRPLPQNPKSFVELAFTDKKAFAQIMSDVYKAPGVSTRWRRVEDEDEKQFGLVTIEGDVFSSDKSKIGHMVRWFTQEGEVTHSSFELENEYQGTGIALHMNHRAEEAYKRMSFSTVSLTADIDVGSYTWALQGYDFSDPEDRDIVLENVIDVIAQRIVENDARESGILKPEKRFNPASFIDRIDKVSSSVRDDVYGGKYGKLKHSWDVATLDDGYDYPWESLSKSGKGILGKAAMLNTMWDGAKRLKENTIGWQVGQEYYRRRTQNVQKAVLDKARIYISSPQEAPQGVKVEQGKRGGLYYE